MVSVVVMVRVNAAKTSILIFDPKPQNSIVENRRKKGTDDIFFGVRNLLWMIVNHPILVGYG